MLFQELVDTLGASSADDVRAFLGTVSLPINPKARIIPDQYVDDIIKEYKKVAKKAATKKKEAPTEPESEFESATIISSASEPEEVEEPSTPFSFSMREEEGPRVNLDKFKKKEETKKKSKKRREEQVLTRNDDSAARRNMGNVRTDDFELDIEDEDIVDMTDVDEQDNVAAAAAKIEEEQEREFMRSVRERKAMEPARELSKEDVARREMQRKGGNLKKKQETTIGDVISVKEFAEKMGLPTSQVIKSLLKNGIIVTINHKIDYDTAALIGEELGVSIKKETADISTSDLMSGNLAKMLESEEKESLVDRPPIISIMGHVDHGKTSLLDYIRKSKITSGEAGGITQQIGAYQVTVKDKKITFLDTPGHEAFTAMRARGAKATDIAILVVAADEGVKPQTIEALNHARDAEIPIIVAINKMDKEGANPDKVKGELAEHNLVPEDWGGDVIMTPISALKGDGIDTLLDMVLLVADMGELQANPDREALGTIIESHLDPSLGPVATVLVNTGTLKIMDNFVVGETYGRVKIMEDSHGKRMKEAVPSTPVRIAGISGTPTVGDILQVTVSEKEAREKAQAVSTMRNKSMGSGAGGFSELISRIKMGELKTLKVVLKSDTKGSLEAVRAALLKLNTDEVGVQIIHSGVGNITETDVLMASASGGLVLGFAVSASTQVERTAEKTNVAIKTYRVIYHLTDEIKKLLSGLLDPEMREIHLGDFEVVQNFFTSKKYIIVGGKITKGKLENGAQIRVIRGDKLVGEGVIDSLQKGTESVKELGEGQECGIRFVGKVTPEPKDIFEVYKIERIERSL